MDKQTYPVVRYHKDLAPDGRKALTPEDDDLLMDSDPGWVDSPAKFEDVDDVDEAVDPTADPADAPVKKPRKARK